MKSKQSQILFYIFSLAAFILFVGLGCWQLQRLQEKEAMLAPMRDFDLRAVSIMTLPVDENTGYQLYTYTSRKGLLDQTKPLFRPGAINPYPSANPAERLGYDLYLPLTGNGKAILVNFGWVEPAMRDRMIANAAAKKVFPIEVTVNGWFMAPQAQKTFTPPNNPLENQWFWHDFPAMEAYAGYQFLPFILYNDLNWYGTARAPLWQSIPNNHRQYAWTWFGLALVQLAATIAYGLKARAQS
ncbi:MAG: SURF1 family protein [Alphaproteobacteria bacterium]|nr:MAG: SURF1 family protein [Alphaproteobacteria bacterium]